MNTRNEKLDDDQHLSNSSNTQTRLRRSIPLINILIRKGTESDELNFDALIENIRESCFQALRLYAGKMIDHVRCTFPSLDSSTERKQANIETIQHFHSTPY